MEENFNGNLEEASENGSDLAEESTLSANGANGNGNGNGNGADEAVVGGVGRIRAIDIEHEMRGAYLDYAMSVIVARALPDARDGMKPVHRRILYTMYDMGLRHSASYRKSARIVGDVLGKYHPHGDSAVYDALARMAQDFSLRYMLVDGQGNFGSVDGDAPAAMRYTEARLSAIAEELLVDIDRDTIDWGPNYDGSMQEPLVLPAKLPNLLLNGTSGIAVGMATNIPPHNLSELADAITYCIDHWERIDDISVDELMQFVKGPDFPTGATIIGTEGIRAAYGPSGRGRVVMRAVSHIEEMRSGRYRILVTEIPYQVNKASLIERIAELVRAGKIDAISDLRDESDRKGMRIVIELRRGAQPRKVLNQLLKLTPLQSSFGVNMLALVNGEPRNLSLRKALHVYIDHRQEVLTRRTRFELNKARERAHILEGLRIALQFIDDVIATIRAAADANVARSALMAKFTLTEAQAQAILQMTLGRLAALERQRIEDEYQELLKRIAYLQTLLDEPEMIRALIKEDVQQLKEKYGDDRRTEILTDASDTFSEEDLIARERVLVTVTQNGYIKRTMAHIYRAQARGGRGVQGMSMREEDMVIDVFSANTLDTILFFTNRGRVYSERAYRLPDGQRGSRGTPLVNVINLQSDERVTAMLAVSHFGEEDILLCTRLGTIKRMPLNEFAAVRPSGIIAMNLDDGDELGWVRHTKADDHAIIVTARGQALRFPVRQVRQMGRAAGGVIGMRLPAGDRLVAMDIVEPKGQLLVVTSNGFGKRTNLDQYPVHSRGGHGVRTIDTGSLDKIGEIAAATVVGDHDQVTFITRGGIALRTNVKHIASSSRSTRGVHLVNLRGDDVVVAAARLKPEAERKEEEHPQARPAEDLEANEEANEMAEEITEPAAEIIDDTAEEVSENIE